MGRYFSGGLYCSLLRLRIFASHRYVETVGVANICVSNTAIRGISVNAKGRYLELTNWATPLTATLSGNWYAPLFSHGEELNQRKKGELNLCTHGSLIRGGLMMFGNSPMGAVQARLTRLERDAGFKPLLKIHSHAHTYFYIPGSSVWGAGRLRSWDSDAR